MLMMLRLFLRRLTDPVDVLLVLDVPVVALLSSGLRLASSTLDVLSSAWSLAPAPIVSSLGMRKESTLSTPRLTRPTASTLQMKWASIGGSLTRTAAVDSVSDRAVCPRHNDWISTAAPSRASAAPCLWRRCVR